MEIFQALNEKAEAIEKLAEGEARSAEAEDWILPVSSNHFERFASTDSVTNHSW